MLSFVFAAFGTFISSFGVLISGVPICGTNWEEACNSSYCLGPANLFCDWVEAELGCSTYESRLASIASMDEHECIKEIMRNHQPNEFWLGISRDGAGIWGWTDGTSVAWLDSTNSLSATLDVSMDGAVIQRFDGSLYPRSKTGQFSYICKKHGNGSTTMSLTTQLTTTSTNAITVTALNTTPLTSATKLTTTSTIAITMTALNTTPLTSATKLPTTSTNASTTAALNTTPLSTTKPTTTSTNAVTTTALNTTPLTSATKLTTTSTNAITTTALNTTPLTSTTKLTTTSTNAITTTALNTTPLSITKPTTTSTNAVTTTALNTTPLTSTTKLPTTSTSAITMTALNTTCPSGQCCKCQSCNPPSFDDEELVELDIKSLSKWRRRRTCAEDDRPSAKSIGSCGAAVCIVVVVVITALDFLRVTTGKQAKGKGGRGETKQQTEDKTKERNMKLNLVDIEN